MKTITAIVECPKGSGYKYDYEPKFKRFKLSKILPAGLVFPFDFGFIPRTKGEDGDPLDIIIISEMASFTGCAIDCRIIGAIKAEQTERDGKSMRNDRFLAIPHVSLQFASINEADQLPEGIMKQLESFFKNYNRQAGKKFKVLAQLNAAQATRLIK
ncbi:MAG: inorganic diphosphatase [Mucilaginibacter sp.]